MVKLCHGEEPGKADNDAVGRKSLEPFVPPNGNKRKRASQSKRSGTAGEGERPSLRRRVQNVSCRCENDASEQAAQDETGQAKPKGLPAILTGGKQ